MLGIVDIFLVRTLANDENLKKSALTVKNGQVLCKTLINVGNIGIQNYYKQHKGTKQCKVTKLKSKQMMLF